MLRLFQNKRNAFWILQIVGWLGYGAVRALNGMAHGTTVAYIYPSMVAMVTGFLLSLLLWSVYRSLKSKPLGHIILVATPLSALFGLVFSTIETIGHALLYDPNWSPQGLEFFGNAMFDAYVLLAWTALYFGINYYLMMQAEKEKALEANFMAHQAQLQMLRYQLNPHFLFNTLNAISTLVMDKDTKTANGMLEKLSAFLRYTLINQPTHKVDLAQELDTLKLYLEIEKVRFGDRLTLVWKIQEKAKGALIPSLILQPLIENAIKYAVAPAERGGSLEIRAKVEKGFLDIRILDDGPGIAEKDAPASLTSSGVGIVNTRERLRQIYGNDHVFRLVNRVPNGLEVRIMVPFETRKQSEQVDS